jgi:6-phosphogluconolactonase
VTPARVEIQVFPDALAAAQAAATRIAAEARAAAAARGRFVLAVSGGRSPWQMLEALAGQDVPWPAVHLVQVDERVAPAGDPDRNATHIALSLLRRAPLADDHVHLMPVEDADLGAAAARYSRTLADLAGTPPVLDLVHLGLGPDGHTASLVPGDPVLGITDADVGLTGPYQGHRRMTVTYPLLDRARRVLWLVTGDDKPAMLARLAAGDPAIPAGRVRPDHAVAFADAAAARLL